MIHILYLTVIAFLGLMLLWRKGGSDPKPLDAEELLVMNFLERKEGSLEPLIEHLRAREFPFTKCGGYYFSNGGLVSVCDDIYGYEVMIAKRKGYGYGRMGSAELLDARPEAYGLNDEEGRRLFDAILSCVPGSVSYKEKVLSRRGETYGSKP